MEDTPSSASTNPWLKPENRFEFLQLDYDAGIKLIEEKHQLKLGYLKFYITTITLLLSFSVLILRLNGGDTTPMLIVHGYHFTARAAIGLLVLFTTAIGFIVTKNLAGIRTNEVFAANAVTYIRKCCIREFELGNEYPQREYATSVNREGADYITIIVCSALNCVVLLSGIFLVFGTASTWWAIPCVLICYLLSHYLFVERTLIEADKDFTRPPRV